MTDLAETATLPTVATATNAGAAVRGAADVVTASKSTKGLITLDSADQANADTLPDWVVIASTMTVEVGVTVFKFGSNACVF